ncbi:XdhC family protein [Arcobacter sp.]|uniref:XdhC family protein n=1 Tax=unclassified Arcobacter TaxID=2593671 RepID=UPI003AFFADC4
MFENKQYLKFIQKSKKEGLDLVGVSVIQTLGSTYAKAGNLMLINSNFEFVGVLGSKHLHKQILEYAKAAFKNQKSKYFENIPKDESSGHGTSKYFLQVFPKKDDYGVLDLALKSIDKTLIRNIKNDDFVFTDRTTVTKFEDDKFYQEIKMPYSILIFGSGAHITSFISMANLMGWKTTLMDININRDYVSEVDEIIELENFEDILTMDLSEYNASVILSHSPKTDDTYLKALLNSKVEYIGVMGNKISMRDKKEKFKLEDDKRFFAPVGFEIGGHTHQSIALSICAQIEARKNGKIH